MKSFKAKDSFKNMFKNAPWEMAFLIARPNPKKERENSELPVHGQTVEIDGEQFVVRKAAFMGDSEFNWWPEIIIFV